MNRVPTTLRAPATPLSSTRHLHYDLDWRDLRQLRDGRALRLRLIRPSDKPLFDAAFEHLSSSSRYHRFFTGKHHLTGTELVYFTEVDGLTHLAVGATTADGADGVAVGRFVRVDEGVAEPAVTVVDEWQGQGLGSLLLEILRDAALERGYHSFRALALADNHAALRMMERVFPGLEVEPQGTVCVLTCPLARPTA